MKQVAQQYYNITTDRVNEIQEVFMRKHRKFIESKGSDHPLIDKAHHEAFTVHCKINLLINVKLHLYFGRLLGLKTNISFEDIILKHFGIYDEVYDLVRNQGL